MNKKYLFIVIIILLLFNSFIFSQQEMEISFSSSDGYLIGSELDVLFHITHIEAETINELRKFKILYDPLILQLNTPKGVNGIEIDTDYQSMAVSTPVSGEIIIQIQLNQETTDIRIHFIALQSGTSPFAVEADPDIYTIQSGDIHIFENYGDVNNNGEIDIVDALLVAQWYVGTSSGIFISAAGDVNCDNKTDIVDALLVAQHYVGIINGFSSCDGTSSPTPSSAPSPTPFPSTGILGDINEDGKVDFLDCYLITQYLNGANFTIFTMDNADMNHDGKIDETDKELICTSFIIIND